MSALPTTGSHAAPRPPSAPAVRRGDDLDAADRAAAAVCRSCDRQGLELILDLGRMPPSDHLLTEELLSRPEPRFPLVLAFCPDCALVQITETVDPALLFGEQYQYFSSFSDTLLEHARKHAESLLRSRNLGPDSLVVELASNDGYMLRNFQQAGIPVLGIDPSPGPAAAARAAGIDTRCEFFGRAMAERLAAEGRRADVIIANNVVAHVADTNGFIAGMRTLIKNDGLISVEFPYVRDLVDFIEFDTIYHEHLCYFSVTAADRLFRRHGLYVNQVERVPIHGGSLRLLIETRDDPRSSVRDALAEEQTLGIDTLAYYQGFARRVDALRKEMLGLLAALRSQGKRIAAYGAAAKGSILLNYLGLDASTIEFCVDRNVHKHGRYMPGCRARIHPTQHLLTEKPDYTLILPWNFKDEIIRQQTEYLAAGGHFIVPIPQPTIIGG